MNSPLFKSFFITLLVVGFWNAIAFYFHLFDAITNFDMTFHFLGGFFIGLSALTVLTATKNDVSYGKLLLWGVTTALVVGLLWEVYELSVGITYWGMSFWPSWEYLADNGMDVTMDTFGGLVAVLYAYNKLRNFNYIKNF